MFQKISSRNPTSCFITLLILFSSLIMKAQNDWKPGYIIQLKGDTVNGFIDYRSPSALAVSCYFRTNENAPVNKFNPSQIKGYRFEGGKFFISKRITSTESDSLIFLEYLLSGKISIYYANTGSDRYYVENDSILLELKNTEQIIQKENTRFQTPRKEYIGQLIYLMSDGQMQDYINHSTLDHKSMISLGKRYHQQVCRNDDCIIFEKKTTKTEFMIGPVYGLSYRQLNLNRYREFGKSDKLSHYGGISFNLGNIAGIYERLSLAAQILVITYTLEEENKLGVNFPVMVRYRLTAHRFYPFAEAGFSAYYVRNDWFKSGHFAFSGGIGLAYENKRQGGFFIQSRYENYPGTVRLGIGYHF